MKAKIIRIGNSQGIRIPKPILEQTGLGENVELEVVDNQIIIRPSSDPRAGWKAAFERMAREGDDTLMDPDSISSDWDEQEWTW
ncbi:MAG: AbrB/MazE/SpoVT family DNA-binding domain-containing protein [Geminicoccaceae bacterium]